MFKSSQIFGFTNLKCRFLGLALTKIVFSRESNFGLRYKKLNKKPKYSRKAPVFKYAMEVLPIPLTPC